MYEHITYIFQYMALNNLRKCAMAIDEQLRERYLRTSTEVESLDIGKNVTGIPPFWKVGFFQCSWSLNNGWKFTFSPEAKKLLMRSGIWSRLSMCSSRPLWKIGSPAISALQRHNTEIWSKYSQKRNCVASVPISTFMCLWERFIHSHNRSASSAAGKYVDLEIYKSLTDTWIWKLGLRPCNSFSGKTYMGFSFQSEYKCSRIAPMAAMDLKGDFSAEKRHIFSCTLHIFEFR